MIREAKESQEPKYHDDWVFSFVKGDGKEFDFGIDVHECGVLKFFSKENADGLTPFYCWITFLENKALGTGLVGTRTLVEGAEKCDYRFKKGRKVEVGWPPDFLKRIEART